MLPDLITSIAAFLTSIGALTASIVSARRAGKAETSSAIAAAEVSPNHGGSMKDSINRIEIALRHIAEIQRSQGHQIGEIRRDATQTHGLLADRTEDAINRITRLENKKD